MVMSIMVSSVIDMIQYDLRRRRTLTLCVLLLGACDMLAAGWVTFPMPIPDSALESLHLHSVSTSSYCLHGDNGFLQLLSHYWRRVYTSGSYNADDPRQDQIRKL